MEAVFSRYRTLIILAVALSLQVLGLAVQVRRNTENGPTRLVRLWTVAAISPLEKGIVHAGSALSYSWRNYFYLRGVRQENRDLKAEVERMKLEQIRMQQDAAQAHRLQLLLGFREQVISQTVGAQVIGTSGSEQSRSLYIDKGSHDGLNPDMAVITADGIVGKVLKVYPSTAMVLMINDQSSGVGVILAKSRLQGVLRGTAGGELVVEKVMADEQVPIGEQVLTSGGDTIFPKGMPVGTVTQVFPGAELFLTIHVKPAAILSKVEEVLVVTKKVEQTPPDDGGPIRASDILAQRLPGVPQKPADTTAPNAATAASGTAGAQTGTPAPGNAGTGTRGLQPANTPPATPLGPVKPGVGAQSAKPSGSVVGGAQTGKPSGASTGTVTPPASGQANSFTTPARTQKPAAMTLGTTSSPGSSPSSPAPGNPKPKPQSQQTQPPGNSPDAPQDSPH
jgi:rod shape-determining protein MreC